MLASKLTFIYAKVILINKYLNANKKLTPSTLVEESYYSIDSISEEIIWRLKNNK